jgi:Zn finger protein HypA/HybF involved in hydrogenase expression
VRVVVADSTPYLEEALAMFWDEACAATEAAGARIECVRRPGEWLCLDCLHQCSGGGTGPRCPECGSEWMKPISGEDCYVDSIDVDTSGA